MIQLSFMTGSRIYGTPTEASDWDVVILCDRSDAIEFFGAKDDPDDGYDLDERSWQTKIRPKSVEVFKALFAAEAKK